MAIAAPIKTERIVLAADPFEPTPDEIAGILAALRQKKANDAASAEADRIRKETGYPKTLYNSKYKGESILMLDGVNRKAFYRHKLVVIDAADEAFIRAACPGRIFEADMPSERACKRCDFATASSDCWDAHMDAHL